MSRNIFRTVVALALASMTTLALADDPPTLVGRVSSVQGPVTLQNSEGDSTAAGLNWPVTSANHLTTGRDGQAEFRIGSAAVRLGSDSDLEITELDDDNLRLRLNYGTANVRIKSPDMVRGFELTTPQARVTLVEPASVRADVERQPDTSTISVLGGSAQVDGVGTMVTLRTGKQIDVTSQDIRTGNARRDAFDDWAQARDRADDSAVALRYVPAEMTGYEDLDRNGSWVDNQEYGPLWTPSVVPVGWAPYRDGQWVWLAPWGWTWVDNAPWGYAPSHYGRWVMVGSRWCWAPGRYASRPVWAPALVGWVGGAQWSVAFGNGRAPGMGWYPLAPREAFVPAYHVSVEVERRLAWTPTGRYIDHPLVMREHPGVTVLPSAQFEGRHLVQVNNVPHGMLTPNAFKNLPAASAPPAAPARAIDGGRQEVRDAARGGRVITAEPSRQAGQPQAGRVIGNEPSRYEQPRAAVPSPNAAMPVNRYDPRNAVSAPALAPAAAAEERGRFEQQPGRVDEGNRYRPAQQTEALGRAPSAFQQPAQREAAQPQRREAAEHHEADKRKEDGEKRKEER